MDRLPDRSVFRLSIFLLHLQLVDTSAYYLLVRMQTIPCEGDLVLTSFLQENIFVTNSTRTTNGTRTIHWKPLL